MWIVKWSFLIDFIPIQLNSEISNCLSPGSSMKSPENGFPVGRSYPTRAAPRFGIGVQLTSHSESDPFVQNVFKVLCRPKSKLAKTRRIVENSFILFCVNNIFLNWLFIDNFNFRLFFLFFCGAFKSPHFTFSQFFSLTIKFVLTKKFKF